MLASLLVALSPAYACPTIATGTPSALSFDTAQVAIVRQGTRTTFSVSINPVGDPQEFALLMPVPEVLGPDEVRTLDPEIFHTLDAFTAPRRVDDAGCEQPDSDGDTGESEPGGDGGVDVEADYLVGEYRVVILSAEESAGLQAWLDDNGFHLPEGAEPRLREYIDAGSFFLAARVAEEAAVADGGTLSPLQVSYDSEVFAIPIRLATLNSPGVQDMVVYALNERADGRAGISNYPEFEVSDRCIWGDPATDAFAEFYGGQFEAAWNAVDDAGWTVEFSGGPADCNPCTSVFPTETDAAELGYTGALDGAYFTRLHLRYTPEQAQQDLVLYHSRIDDPEVTSFADDNASNRECIDVCGAVPDDEIEDTGDTDEPGDTDDTRADPPASDADEGDGGCGCATPATGMGGAWVVAGIGAMLAGRRRRG